MFVIRQTDLFSSWLRSLRDQRAKQKVTGRLQRLKFGHFGDVEPVGHGVSELRIDEGNATASIFASKGMRSSYCFAEVKRKTSSGTLRRRSASGRSLEMKHEITDFDPAEYLGNDEMIAGYLSDALETQDPAFIADAIGVVARAKGMKRVAEDAGVSRESLYRALSANGNPEFGTVLKVLASLNIKLIAQPDGVGTHDTAA